MLSHNTVLGHYDSPESFPHLGNTLPEDPSVKWGTHNNNVIVAMEGVGVRSQKYAPGDWKLHMYVTGMIDDLKRQKAAILLQSTPSQLPH